MNIEWLVYFAKETGMDHAACLLVHALLGLNIYPDKYLSYYIFNFVRAKVSKIVINIVKVIRFFNVFDFNTFQSLF